MTETKSRLLLHLIATALAALSLACQTGEPPTAFRGVTTVAGAGGEFGETYGIAFHDGQLFVSDGEAGKIFRISTDGRAAEFASGLNTPSGLAVDADGNLITADAGAHTIVRIDANGNKTVIAGAEGKGGFADGAAALFRGPTNVAVGPDGRVFVSDTYNDRIRVVENGRVSTFAGGERGFADGPNARFDTPLGIAVWGERLLVADAGNRRIRAIDPNGTVWTVAGDGSGDLIDGPPLQAAFVLPSAITVDASGVIYIADGNAIRALGRRTFAFVETISNDRRGYRNGRPYGSMFNRPSGLAIDDSGRLIVADSDNKAVRAFGFEPAAPGQTPPQMTAEAFRGLQPARWPYDPPEAKRDIAGTLGEIRGEFKDERSFIRFHNGLDIAGGFGETARFIRNEKTLDPLSAENYGTLRELLRLPTIGYIHINLGREANGRSFGDDRFLFSNGPDGKPNSVRVPRGAAFRAGEPIGTLNAMNHVHMIAGPTGGEMNALDALILPNVSDSIAPTIEEVKLFGRDWNEIETKVAGSRIRLSENTRIVVRAFDRMDGNPERRKLGVFKLGYQVIRENSAPPEISWTIVFERNPPPDAVRIAYGPGSKSGATGETIFNYVVTNRLNSAEIAEDFLEPAGLQPGNYTIRVFAADFFGNQTHRDILIEVSR